MLFLSPLLVFHFYLLFYFHFLHPLTLLPLQHTSSLTCLVFFLHPLHLSSLSRVSRNMKPHKPKPQKPNPPKAKSQKPENKKTKTPKGALWTTPMRHVLCCLFRFFNDNGPDNKDAFEKIFSWMFQNHIIQRRKQDILPFNTIYTQWAWMRRTHNAVWKHAHIDTPFSHEQDWKRVVEDIKSTATALKIRLVERTSDTTADPSWAKESNQSVHFPEYFEPVLLSVRNVSSYPRVTHLMPRPRTPRMMPQGHPPDRRLLLNLVWNNFQK